MIVFRADGSDKIGSGHLMRCMTIATAVKDISKGRQKILFVTALEESATFIRNKGFDAVVLGKIELSEEIPEMVLFLQREKPEWLFVDSYKVTKDYLKEMSQYTRVGYMDDFGNEAYPVNMLVNYNIFADKAHYSKLYDGLDTVCLIGPEYIPVRNEFADTDYVVKEEMTDVLLLTGGGDYCHLSEQFIDCFGNVTELSGIRFHLICGYYNERMEILKEKVKAYTNFILYENVSNMAELMQCCDLALTAGGSTVYELCSVGVPFVGYSFADNQHPLMNYVGEHNIAPCLGDYRQEGAVLLEKMAKEIVSYKDVRVRKDACRKVKGFVDGMGAGRIADKLLIC